MDKEKEKWAIFWCDLLGPVIFNEIDAGCVNLFLKQTAQKTVRFPDGQIRKPSLSTLRRKLKRFRQGGFDGLDRKKRSDCGNARNTPEYLIKSAIELKREQPHRTAVILNQFLKEKFSMTVPRSTLYRHLKNAGATRSKLGVLRKKVRKRWSRDHTHDLWIGDFEEGPYIEKDGDVLATCLSAFIDCHSRYVVDARYYLRQNLDVLIDSLIRAFSTHGAPLALYVDNAKVYHSNGLKAACYRTGIKLLHRPPKDPAPGGLIERFFQTIQGQLEAEVRAGELPTLSQLNRALSAWLHVSYHQIEHSEIKQTPQIQYQKGLRAIRQVDMQRVIDSFMQRLDRTVNKTFSDVQVQKRFYQVDPKLRGDRVQVRFDPFGTWDKVKIYSLSGTFLGTGTLHHRQHAPDTDRKIRRGKPVNSYTELLIRQHKKQLAEQAGGIDYRKVVQKRSWPFHEFAKTVAQLLGRKAVLTGLTAGELEILKKLYNQSLSINRTMVKKAFERAYQPTLAHIVAELKQLIKEKETDNVP